MIAGQRGWAGWLAAMLLAAGTGPASAQNILHRALGAPDNLIITGAIRLRSEAIAGQFRPQPFAANDQMVSVRSNIFAEYDTGPVRIGAEIMDSRAYFEAENSSVSAGDVNSFALLNAYLGFDLEDALGTGTLTTVTAGRMTIDFGSRRLLARNAFRNAPNAFTGVRMDWRGAPGAGGEADSAILFWTMPVIRLPRDREAVRDNRFEVDRQSLATQFFGGGYTWAGRLGGSVQLYALALIERDQDDLASLDRRLLTSGVRFLRAPRLRQWDHDVEIVYQMGVTATSFAADAPMFDVDAWFVHAAAGYSFAAPWSPRLVVQFDLATGDRAASSSFNGFDPLYGARRWEYGPTSLFGPVGRTNLLSPALRLEVMPDPRWDAFVAWRPLWLQSRTAAFSFTGVRDPTGAAGGFAGHQLEARGRYWLVPRLLQIDAGVALLAKSDFFRLAPNGRDDGDSRYGYVDITLMF